jgi:threonine/homoserine/homoserine lactone efflux protein
VIQASTALSFAATATAMVITPGAGFVLFSSTMLTSGRRAALALWGGIAVGTIVFAAIVVIVYPLIVGGIGGFRGVLQIAGGLYLIYLGGLGVYRARQHRLISLRNAPAARSSQTTNELAIAGLTSALTNPGLFVVYVLLLPTFVPPSSPWTPTAATLAAEHIGIMNAWYVVLFVAIGRARGYFTNETRQAAVTIVSSLVLVALGVRTLVQAF